MINPTNISAVVVAKNEEKNIKKCLESIKWIDEIIFIDNHSQDRTLQIAKRYTNKIWKRKKIYRENLNFAFKKVTKDWILLVDADELITENCKKEISERINNTEFDAFYFNFKQYFFGKEFVGPLWTKTKIIRLFRKGKGFYEEVGPHTTLKIKGTIGRIKNPIIHDGYPDIETFIKKMDLYTTQAAKLLSEGKSSGLLKKKILKINFYTLIIEPLLFFPYYFIIKQNYKDGVHGMILSILMTLYLFTERAKLWRINAKGGY